ncbi:MarR family winged helix-turn-helix transcriptional regulator [Patulibacter minatonensis]|uniref:MarR family winged helix-turn-helix transcriptional regulator n=1 Tax=Patulibacter minatonensis TaxID=298163 RepID=UPI0004BB61FD|nr:MarR family transcriptional regulator [Patulibacter minatonensis]
MTAADDVPALPDDVDAATAGRRELELQLRRLTRALRRVRGHGNQHLGPLSMPQYLLVEPLLDAGEPLPVGTLAEIAGTAAPTATTMVRKLEAQGLVVRSRDPADGRVVRLALTDEGRALAGGRRAKVLSWRRGIAETVAPEDRAAGARALAALADAIDASADQLAALGQGGDPGAD